MADAVPTRRSSRANGVSTTPQAVVVATSPAESRALSRRETRASSVAPTVVWGAPRAEASAVASVPASVEPVEPAEAPAAPVTVRDEPARARLRPRVRPVAVEPVSIDEESLVVAEEVVEQSVKAPEPVADEPSADEPSTITGPVVTDFDAAARLFAFTGETPLIHPAALAPGQARATAAAQTQVEASTGALSPQQPTLKRKLATTAFSVGVMSIVALMTVSVSAPAEALAAASDTLAVTIVAPEPKNEVIKPEEIQAFVAPAEGEVVELDRDQTYALTTFEQIARESGIHMTKLFVNDANSAIQWPFAVGVGMSYGFGSRSGRMHEGIDFTPGAGAQVQAVAEGTVRVATESGGAYGVHVYIDHVVDGQMISSHYAHMQYGSLQVVQGQHVMAGDPIGKTGNTGRSYGAHMHFELRVNGVTAIDPLPWLQKHAGGWQG